MNDAFDPDDDEALAPSKSARKREMHRLQSLGEELLSLSNSERASFNLPQDLDDAMAEALRIRQREAKRRQIQLIGKLMRKADPEVVATIEHGLALRRERRELSKQFLHQVEQWRDRILSEGDPAIADFVSQYPDADRQWFRQLYRQHQREIKNNAPPAAARKVFREIRELLAQ